MNKPTEKRPQISVYIEREILTKLKAIAQSQERSVSAIAGMAIREKVNTPAQ